MAVGDWDWGNTGGVAIKPIDPPEYGFDKLYQVYQERINELTGLPNEQYVKNGNSDYTVTNSIDTEKQDLKNRLSNCEEFIKLIFNMLKGTNFQTKPEWASMQHIINTITPQILHVSGRPEKEKEEDDEPLLEDKLFEIDF